MAKILLLAASGLAREAAESIRADGRDEILGLLDDDESRHSTLVGGVRVLGSLDEAVDYPHARLLVCAGRGHVRARIVGRLTEFGIGPDRYATVVDPTVRVPPSCTVGAGSILLSHAVLTSDVAVGDHVVMMPRGTLTHDDVVGDYATLAAGASIGGGAEIGPSAYIGMNASVRQNLTIHRDSTLGMGSVLLQDLPAGQTWAGNPARQIHVRQIHSRTLEPDRASLRAH